MFKKTDPQQNLFGVDTNLAPGMRTRLKASWAEMFKREILPILMRAEPDFAFLYGIVGRPNFSVGRLLGLCLLQELNNLSDQEALDAFGFDARWQYALDINAGEEAYLSRRSLVEFRRRLVEQDAEMSLMHGLFGNISDQAIRKLGLSVREQRLDSTHVVSNIHTHGRIDLFQSTIKLFIRRLEESKYQLLPARIRGWYEKESNGWFGLGTKKEKREKLHRLASFLHQLIVLFEKDKEVNGREEYRLLVKLFGEHCELKENTPSPKEKNAVVKVTEENDTTSDANENGDESKAVEADSKSVGEQVKDKEEESGAGDKKEGQEIKIKKNSSGDTLQSPHDPDATYGHKGVGYSAQIAETCNNERKPEIITACEIHGAARSDVGKVPDVLDQLENTSRKPKIIYADGGYPSVPSTPQVMERDVELVAPVNRGPMDEKLMGRDRFEFDEECRVIQCPAGHQPIDHRVLSNGTERTLHAVFDGNNCRCCSMLEQCPVRAPNHRERGCTPSQTKGNFRLEVTAALLIRDKMYAEQQTPEWKERYKIRSGVEATMSEMKGCHGLGKLRVRGLARVRFAVICKVIACNIRRWAGAQTASGGIFPYAAGLFSWLEYKLGELRRRIRMDVVRNGIIFTISLYYIIVAHMYCHTCMT